jgi:hypothetical protein
MMHKYYRLERLAAQLPILNRPYAACPLLPQLGSHPTSLFQTNGAARHMPMRAKVQRKKTDVVTVKYSGCFDPNTMPSGLMSRYGPLE